MKAFKLVLIAGIVAVAGLALHCRPPSTPTRHSPTARTVSFCQCCILGISGTPREEPPPPEAGARLKETAERCRQAYGESLASCVKRCPTPM